MSRQGVHHNSLPPPPTSVSLNPSIPSSHSGHHLNSISTAQFATPQPYHHGQQMLQHQQNPQLHNSLSSSQNQQQQQQPPSNSNMTAHGGSGGALQTQNLQQNPQSAQQQQQQILPQNLPGQSVNQEQYRENALQRIRDDLKPFQTNKNDNQVSSQLLLQQHLAQRRPSSASSNASSSCSYSVGLSGGTNYLYNGLISPASSVSSYGQIGGSNKSSGPALGAQSFSTHLQATPANQATIQPTVNSNSNSNSFASSQCDNNSSSGFMAINDQTGVSTQSVRQFVEKTITEDILAKIQEADLMNALVESCKMYVKTLSPQQLQQMLTTNSLPNSNGSSATNLSSTTQSQQQQHQQHHQKQHQIVIDRANHHLGSASLLPSGNINSNSLNNGNSMNPVAPPPPPSLIKNQLRTKPPSPSTSQMESLESSSYYSERSAASCLSSSCSVRSESPGSNLHSQQPYHLNGGHLLPDRPKIVSSDGIVIPSKNTNYSNQLNQLNHSSNHQNGGYVYPHHHPKIVQTDSSDISCSEYSSGSFAGDQPSQHSDYSINGGGYPNPPTPYHKLPQQQQKLQNHQQHQQFNESAQPAAIAAKQMLTTMISQNMNQQKPQQAPKLHSTGNFRPTDPVPPPPLPYRSSIQSSTGFINQPPPVPPHNGNSNININSNINNNKNYSFPSSSTISGSTNLIGQSPTFAYPSNVNGQSQSQSVANGFASQITQKLQHLSLSQTQTISSNFGGQGNSSSPPPSYAASSSSGKQSPTPTISSSSDYASIPIVPAVGGQKRTEILDANFKLKATGIARSIAGPSMATGIAGFSEVDSGILEQNRNGNSNGNSEKSNEFHAWPAKHAQTQSPVIMQSVKSQKVQKPILQTAIAPSMPSIAGSLTGSQQLLSGQQKTQPRRPNAPTGFATQPTAPVHSATSLLSPMANNINSNNINGNSTINGNHNNGNIVPPPSYKPQKTNPPPYPTSYNPKPDGQTYYSNPPPPYSSTANPNPTIQQPSSVTQIQRSQQQQSSTPGSPAPPPPLPPPYAMSLSQQQHQGGRENSLAPLFRPTGSTGTASIYSMGSNSSSSTANPNVQVPTTDPPSYASSMAALAAQRSQASTGPSTTTSGACKTISSTPNSLPPSMINRQLPSPPSSDLRHQLMEGDSSNSSSNCDLVNTVESICTSQISALQGLPTSHRNGHLSDGEVNVPPLPPKPSSSKNDQAPPLPPLPPSLHNQLVSDVQSVASSADDYSLSHKGAGEDSEVDQFEDVIDPETGKRIHTSPIPTRRNIPSAREKEFKIKSYSPAACKFYIEQRMENLFKNLAARQLRKDQLEKEIKENGVKPGAEMPIRRMLYKKESNHIRLRRAKMDISMFTQIAPLGAGAFGEVSLVSKRQQGTSVLYALKKLKKSKVLSRKQVAHVKAERDILAEADNEWVVKLYYSFQDDQCLYFVMEYIPGGDLMALLFKLNIFDEKLSRFYISELVCAVESVHKMGFIHRDIKPDNVLIDKDGHIKLTDFGLCTGFRWTHDSKYYHDRANSMDFDSVASGWNNVQCDCRQESHQPGGPNSAKPLERRKQRCEHHRGLAISLVGTPNYIAPEVLLGQGYTEGCDWWSVGVILYEMVVGSPPFYANDARDTQDRVINWRTTLQIPRQAKLSPECHDLILKLCCGAEERLGRNSADEIKRHSFFASVDFNSDLRQMEAPYKPPIAHAMDTSNFDPVEAERMRAEDQQLRESENQAGMKGGRYPQHAFFEFTFRRFFDADGQAIPIRTGMRLSTFGSDSIPREDDSSETSSVKRDGANGVVYGTCGTDSTMSETTSSQVSVGDLYDEVCINQHPNTSNSSANSSATATNSSKKDTNVSNLNGVGFGSNGTDSESKGEQSSSDNQVFV